MRKKIIGLGFAIFMMHSSLLSDSSDLLNIEADFTQRIKNPDGGIIIYKGHVYSEESPSDNTLWKYNYPIHKDIYLHEKDVAILDYELEQVVLSKLVKSVSLLDLFYNSIPTGVKFVRTGTIFTHKYLLYLADDGKTIKKINYTDESENAITFEFDKVKNNGVLPKGTFEMKVPSGFDILE